jgi:NAD(P) transhydrogenase subunit alpha
VTPALHTPLMSVTNAISGIIVIGGMLHLSGPIASPGAILGLIAVLIASINIAGGFLVTRRMLAMFHR